MTCNIVSKKYWVYYGAWAQWWPYRTWLLWHVIIHWDFYNIAMLNIFAGNEYVHHITQGRVYELRIDMLDFEGNHAYATYDHFSLEDESLFYTLRLGYYNGNAGKQGHINWEINTLRPRDDIWRHRSGSTLAQVMACCLTATSHNLNQCWLITSKV